MTRIRRTTDPEGSSGAGRRRRFRYYVACSLDGFIADQEGGVDWLKPFHDRDYGIGEFMKTVDAEIVGRRTWEWAAQMGDKRAFRMPTYVLTSSFQGRPAGEGITFFSDATALAARLRAEPGKDIWVVGGGSTAAAMLQAGALDELHVHVMPVVLGAGKPLFGPIGRPLSFVLKEQRSFSNGVVRLVYERRCEAYVGAV